MFARVKKSGKYEYLQIVHNERVGAKVCQRTIATLGRLDVLQATGQVDGVVNSLAKYALHTAALSARREQRPATSIRIGPVLVFERLWDELGVGTILEGLLAGRQFEFPVARAVFTTVLHRLFVSGSDRAADMWCRRYAIEGIELHHFYRAMAWLGEALPAHEQAGATPFASRCVKDLIEKSCSPVGVTCSPSWRWSSLTPPVCTSKAPEARAWDGGARAKTTAPICLRCSSAW